jgi:hypothetical protein
VAVGTLVVGLVTSGSVGLVPAGATEANGPATFTPAAASTTVSFAYTGSAQTWTVPAGITEATFTVYGAQGAQQAFPGANGGLAHAVLPVTPGSSVQINVGGQGQFYGGEGCVLLVGDVNYGAGGFNGGGNGGVDCGSGGGGGASDVRIGGTALANRVLVAGGGGAGAGNIICNGAGDGGGLSGGSATSNAVCSGGGVGGNQTGSAGSGQLGIGGNGSDPVFLAGSGGGGGGGYYGGSGGGAGLAGGGGSGFGPSGTFFANGARAGNGLVTVTYGDSPAITGLSPRSGATGTTVKILGHGFDPSSGGTTVTFGATPATVTSCTSTTCDVVVPPGTGTVGVRLTAFGELTPDTPADDFTFLPAPSISGVSPSSAAPGTTVSITGDGFVTDAGFTNVQFGNQTVPGTCSSRTQCTAVVPAGPIGQMPLRVITPAGSSSPGSFTVLPLITAISPAGGPAAGGTVVIITGVGFSTTAGATAVRFGPVAATAVGCSSSTTCTAVSPPGTGAVDVTVTIGGLVSPVSPVATFTYERRLGEEPPPVTTPPPTTPPPAGDPAPAAPTSPATAVTVAAQFTG